MRYFFIATVFLISIETIGQQVAWKKEIATDLNKYKTEVDASGKGDWVKLQNSNNSATGRQKPTLETLLFFKDNTSYSIKYFEGERRRQLIKRTNGSETNIEFSFEGGIDVIGDEGYMICNDFAHGDGGEFQFLSPQLEKLKVYRPFNPSYNQMKVGYANDIVCIFSLENRDSPSYKLTVLDKSGNEKISKEFLLDNHVAFHVEINNNNILLFTNVYNTSRNNYSSKIIAYNLQLNKLWEKDFPGRVGYFPQSSARLGSLFFTHQDEILSINTTTGSTLWTLNANEFSSASPNLERILEEKIVMDDRYLVLNAGMYNRKTNRYDDNRSAIVDAATGKVLHKETHGATVGKLSVVPLKGHFLIIKDNQIIDYKN
jgi:hypothetical protein